VRYQDSLHADIPIREREAVGSQDAANLGESAGVVEPAKARLEAARIKYGDFQGDTAVTC
jgi:hypothetical protein